MKRDSPPSGVETRGASQKTQEDWVFPRPHQPAELVDQDHEQLQTQAIPTDCFSTVVGFFRN